MSAAAVLIAIMSVAAIPASADVSRVIWFTIQSNMVCSEFPTAPVGAQFRDDFVFNINNISDNPVSVTLMLYKKDGTQYTAGGAPARGLGSDFQPGTQVAIAPNSTIQYYQYYGWSATAQPYNACSERPTHGAIVVNTNSGRLLAVGEFQALRNLPEDTPPQWTVYGRSPVTVNGGQPF